jgi:integrase
LWGFGSAAFGEDVQADVAAHLGPFVVMLGEHGADQANHSGSVGKDADDLGAAADLAVQSFLGIVGPDLYLTALESSHSPSTIRRRLAAISVSHQLAGMETPTAKAGVKSVWAGIRRRNGVAPRKVRAARTKMITTLVEPLGNRLIDVRDRTLILIGFAGALRRSELVALDLDDVEEDTDGLVLRIRRSKTDQEAEGEIRGLPYGSHPATCPVRAWRAWIDASDITTGPAFRGVDRHGHLRSGRLSDRAVADLIKRRAAGAGLEGSFAGHSLRSGFATEGYAQGTPELAIMRHGRWKSASVMRGYVQEGTIWSDNAAARLGL